MKSYEIFCSCCRPKFYSIFLFFPNKHQPPTHVEVLGRKFDKVIGYSFFNTLLASRWIDVQEEGFFTALPLLLRLTPCHHIKKPFWYLYPPIIQQTVRTWHVRYTSVNLLLKNSIHTEYVCLSMHLSRFKTGYFIHFFNQLIRPCDISVYFSLTDTLVGLNEKLLLFK